MRLNYQAPINPLGYGVAGANFLAALAAAGHEVALFPIGGVDPEDRHVAAIHAGLANAARYDPAAPSLRIFHQDQLAPHVGRGKKVGFPFFEVDPLTPVEVHHLNAQDGVCVASQWAAEVAAASGVRRDLHVVPLGVDRAVFHEEVVADRLAPDHTIFFNVGKWEHRKGHDLILAAFTKAFTRADRVLLRMLCYNPLIGPGNEEWARRYKTSPLRDQIDLSPRLGTQAEVARFMAGCDVGLFPARAEGWNLDLLEAMAVGKHVIATDYSAHTEFCDAANARLIAVDGREPAADGVWFRGEGEWARLGPEQEEQMVEHMRDLHRRNQLGELGRNGAGIATARRFSWEAATAPLVAALA